MAPTTFAHQQPSFQSFPIKMDVDELTPLPRPVAARGRLAPDQVDELYASRKSDWASPVAWGSRQSESQPRSGRTNSEWQVPLSPPAHATKPPYFQRKTTYSTPTLPPLNFPQAPSPVVAIGTHRSSSSLVSSQAPDPAYYKHQSHSLPRGRAYNIPEDNNSMSSVASSSRTLATVPSSNVAAAVPSKRGDKSRRFSRFLEPLTKRMSFAKPPPQQQQHKIGLPTFTSTETVVQISADEPAVPKSAPKLSRKSTRRVSKNVAAFAALSQVAAAPSHAQPRPADPARAQPPHSLPIFDSLAPAPFHTRDVSNATLTPTRAAHPERAPAVSQPKPVSRRWDDASAGPTPLTALPSRRRAISATPPARRPHSSAGLAGPSQPAFLAHPPPRTPKARAPKRPSTAPGALIETPHTIEEHRLPSQTQIREAAWLPVVDQHGTKIPFGDLWMGQKTVVVFIRHFWCPLCQDYMFALTQLVEPAMLKKAGVKLVVVSNGSHGMIRAYRKIFKTSFALYTDPTLKVYNTLGMTLRTLDGGPESQRGAYVRHGLVGGITMVVVNAVKVGMPVWKEGGDIEQLGGEFVMGPGLQCTFAHRMRTTRSHAPIQRVLGAAGIDIFARWEQSSPTRGPAMSEADQTQWMAERRRSLSKLRDRKSYRRGLALAIADSIAEGTLSEGQSFCGSVTEGSSCALPDLAGSVTYDEERALRELEEERSDIDTISVRSSSTVGYQDNEVPVVTEVTMLGHSRQATLELVRLTDGGPNLKTGLVLASLDGHAGSSSRSVTPTTEVSLIFTPVKGEGYAEYATPCTSDGGSVHSAEEALAENPRSPLRPLMLVTALARQSFGAHAKAPESPDSPKFVTSDSESAYSVAGTMMEEALGAMSPRGFDCESVYSVMGTAEGVAEMETVLEMDEQAEDLHLEALLTPGCRASMAASVSLDAYPFQEIDTESILSSGSVGSYWDYLEQYCGTDEAEP